MAPGMIDSIHSIDTDLRRGASAAGMTGFAAFIDQLMEALPAMGDGHVALLPILQRALEAQQRADHLGLADILTHELAPLFDTESDTLPPL